MSIQIEKIGKLFGRTQVLQDISLDIASGEMVALLGPSGSGKTTLLRIIAGLEQHSYGALRFHGQDVSRIHAKDRHVGFVFQHYALFRHMTVFDNVAFGLTVVPRKQRLSSQAIKQKVTQLLEMVQLSHLASRFPAQLSGGQKQRVALARALAVEPQILLLDEPFGALDAQVRIELRRWLRQLHDELKFTSVFVTHDQEEAMEVADRVVVMSEGHIEQVGTPDDIWHRPETRFVLEFMGEINQLHGQINGSQLLIDGYEFPLHHASAHQGEVDIFLRPWDITLVKEVDEQHRLPVRVVESGPRGHFWQLTVQPIGWGAGQLSVVWQSSQQIPIRGEHYFLGSQKARIYQGDHELLFPRLAQSA
ncbi:sulfate/thiosulfate ABC transporter ATP-binding protein CysA [Providencia vermicola]|uniref:Sulfate/thiosulfate ABC transporter ATP-binding protein CysA n=2 Tax=Providencia TaxID=586 RepID=A0AAI9I226_PROST|nr:MULTISPECIES: sulfate/thiosulfate ABC transporter ATP-binding protein CysA [Providencia]ELR5042985.1 sulfate/thiosulfate ABC transporter ATP-binding protein CysA [Providencia rettgeri]ELR5037220.1 sulfate/thiosulfate ABC transporter ATP-binding protein CysA [Providencia stuartii]ELR5119439.1 sulfate/thiosulfate ABC transporter ATP-binding protein CysA [Providencia stuartii]ELR5141175.1 sulfate/thiosulfate ABC transporter ATP-binding protein CysA [Providencia stuartii]ELR5290554.1 sulfate/th